MSYSSETCLHSIPEEISTPFKPFAQISMIGFDANLSNEIILSGRIENTFGEDVSRYGFIYTAGSFPPDMNNAIIESGQNLSGTISSKQFISSIENATNQYIYTVSAFAENNAGVNISSPIKVHRHDFDFAAINLPSSAYNNILIEPFNDNSNNWYEGNGSTGTVYDMKSGYYKMIGSSTSIAQTTFNNPAEILQGLDNYEIEAVMDFNSGGTDSYSGIRFEGGTDTFDEYFFGIKKEAYTIGHWNELDIWESLKYDLEYNNISSNGDNVLTIRKIYNEFHLFINGDLVHSFVDFDFDGTRIRLRAGMNTSIDFKQLDVKQIL